jgi:DNA modification methylase
MNELPIGRILQADCLEAMKKFPDNSIDLIATDPPYGLSFMGAEWDTFKQKKNMGFASTTVPNLPGGMRKTTKKENLNYQEWVAAWSSECLRVLKPGAFIFYCMSPRQDLLSRAIIGLENAGFDTGFTSIYWAYSEGFPKAQNVSVAIDKRECQKQLKEKLGREPTKEEFKKEWEGFRKIVGKRHDAGKLNKSIQVAPGGWYTAEREENITLSHSSQAKELEGAFSGFQPKPAVEIIIVAMKPLSEKSYIDQALVNKKGITYLGNCKVPYKNDSDKSQATPQGKCTSKEIGTIGAEPDAGRNLERVEFNRPELKGRFPANLLVSGNVLDNGEISTSGTDCIRQKEGYFVEHGGLGKKGDIQITYGDSGQFSRYFSLDSWWQERIKRLPDKVQKVLPFLIVSKASRSEKEKGCKKLGEKDKINTNMLAGSNFRTDPRSSKGGYENKPVISSVNTHPSIKPIELMSYLITMGSRERDIVLDPFIGTGTTAIACKLLDRQFIGIKKEKEYVDITNARIKIYDTQIKLF